MRTPAISGTTRADTGPVGSNERNWERPDTCGCWLAHASAMAESASRLVSQAARVEVSSASTPNCASTTRRPAPLAASTAARCGRPIGRISSMTCSAMLPGSRVAPGSCRAT